MVSLHFNILDIILFVGVAFIGIRGFIVGFVREILSIVGIIGGIAISSRCAESVGEFISDNIILMTNESYIRSFGFMVAFSLIWIASVIASEFMNKCKPFKFLSFFSFASLSGFFAGLIKGFLLVSLILYIITDINFIKSDKFKDMKDGSYLSYIMINTGKTVLKMDKPINTIETDTKNTVNDIKDKASDFGDDVDNVMDKVTDTKNEIQKLN